MNKENLHIEFENLVVKYLSGSATSEEVSLLEHAVKADQNLRLEFREIKKSWMLALAENRNFDQPKAWENILKQTLLGQPGISDRSKVIKGRFIFKEVLKIAAVFLLLMAGSYGVFYFLQYRTIQSASVDKPVEVILADGSLASLNAASSLSYPKKFKRNERRVELIGEAFFEIESLPAKPFVVQVNDVEIHVVGTSFYVNARADAETIEVVVKTGEVAIISPTTQKLPLSAGDRGVYHKQDGTISLDPVENPNFMSWKTRHIVFENTALKEVFEVLEHTFGVHFTFSDQNLEYCRLTAVFHEKTLDEILGIIAETFVLSYSRQQGIIVVKGGGC